MVAITINPDLCKRCGSCALACPRLLIYQEERGTIPEIREGDLDHCFRCGHCVAICPQGALSHSHFGEGTVTPVVKKNLPSYDQAMELMHSRRSRRVYREKDVERDVIEKVLEAARFAPSGHNEQTTEIVVVYGRNKVREIADLTAAGLKRLSMPAQNRVAEFMMRLSEGRRSAGYLLPLMRELSALVEMYERGEDHILNDPPVLLLFCADSVGGTFAGNNATLALHNAALAAETLGLGCYYTGFVIHVSLRDNRIAKHIGLPDTHKIYGALAMGYPRLKYAKWPERNPSAVTWLGDA